MTIAPADIPDHVVYLKVEGRVDAEAIRAAVAQIEEKLARHERIGVVSDVTGFDGLTADGLLEDLRQQFAYLGRWHRFPYLALVAEDGPLKTMAEAAAPLLPQATVRVFAPGETKAAIAFAAQAAAPLA